MTDGDREDPGQDAHRRSWSWDFSWNTDQRALLVALVVCVWVIVLWLLFFAPDVPPVADASHEVRRFRTNDPNYEILEVEYRGRVHSFLARGHGLAHFESRDATSASDESPSTAAAKGVPDK